MRVRLKADHEHRGFGAGGNDEDAGQGVGGRHDHQMRGCVGQELAWGTGTDQEPHDQAEIVAGDVHEVAFVPFEEAGLPGFELAVWHGLYAPKGTPPEAIEKLSTALQEALNDPTLKQRYAELGAEPPTQDRATPTALDAHLNSRRKSRSGGRSSRRQASSQNKISLASACRMVR